MLKKQKFKGYFVDAYEEVLEFDSNSTEASIIYIGVLGAQKSGKTTFCRSQLKNSSSSSQSDFVKIPVVIDALSVQSEI